MTYLRRNVTICTVRLHRFPMTESL